MSPEAIVKRTTTMAANKLKKQQENTYNRKHSEETKAKMSAAHLLLKIEKDKKRKNERMTILESKNKKEFEERKNIRMLKKQQEGK